MLRPLVNTIWVVSVLAVALVACTDAGLQLTRPEMLTEFDNLLALKGEYCVQPDETVDFPVKVLIAFDQSASLQCTDPSGRRGNALDAMIGDLLSNPVAQVGLIGFASWTRITSFTRDRGAILDAANPAGGGGVATDYQGALATAVRVLEQDMVDAGPAVRARTRYMVVFVSDGVPEPRCNAGCEDDLNNCADDEDNDGDGRVDAQDEDCDNIADNLEHPDNLYGICNTTREIPEGDYVEFDSVCPAYNQPDQIMARVNDIVALGDIYSAGEVTLSTVFLFAPQADAEAVCGPVAAAFGYDQDEARVLLRAMAKAGDGTFTDVNVSTAADDRFLQFEFRSLESPLSLSSFMPLNQHARLHAQELGPDTDTDGLADALEIEQGTDPKGIDSDLGTGDLYSDLLETRHASSGFDPLDPDQPAVGCTEQSDLDGDGLFDCEETILGTDPRHPDSDDDGVLDWIELALGTDPATADAMDDLDLDGTPNGDEIAGGTDPLTPDADTYRDYRVQTVLRDLGVVDVERWPDGLLQERHCYEYNVQNLQLVTTPLVPDRGLNRILLYAQEEPAQLGGALSQVYVACFEVFYSSPTSKDPEDGVIDITADNWDATILGIQDELDALLSCGWFSAEAFDRAAVEGVVRECLGDGVQLGRFMYSPEEAARLLTRYIASNNAIDLPRPPSELFVPIENFSPRQHCYRPWELARLSDLFLRILEACEACSQPSATDSGGAVSDAATPDAGVANACCDRLRDE